MKRTGILVAAVAAVSLTLGGVAGVAIGHEATIQGIKADMEEGAPVPDDEAAAGDSYQDETAGNDGQSQQAFLDAMRDDASGWQDYFAYDNANDMLIGGENTCEALRNGDPIEVIVDEMVDFDEVTVEAAEYQVKASSENLCPETQDRLPF